MEGRVFQVMPLQPRSEIVTRLQKALKAVKDDNGTALPVDLDRPEVDTPRARVVVGYDQARRLDIASSVCRERWAMNLRLTLLLPDPDTYPNKMDQYTGEFDVDGAKVGSKRSVSPSLESMFAPYDKATVAKEWAPSLMLDITRSTVEIVLPEDSQIGACSIEGTYEVLYQTTGTD